MARKAFNDRRKAIAESLARMLLHYLKTHIFPGLTDKELSERTGISSTAISVPWFQDIPEICEGAGLDIGLTVRDSKGNEVTFWPPENFSQGYKPPKVARKPLPPVQTTHVYDYRAPRPSRPVGGAITPHVAPALPSGTPKQLTLEGEFED
jgi:hypothetical protein